MTGLRNRPAVIVIAKAPVAGRVKTRLTPPLTPDQAADLAAAALDDTLVAATTTDASRVVVALEGPRAAIERDRGVEFVRQRGRGLDERIAAAFDDVGGPALLIGMDTPQLDAARLSAALDALDNRAAVFGPAHDGGFWAVGVRTTVAGLFVGVPMSASTTGAEQLRRLRAASHDVALLDTLRDVDTFDDALVVAAEAPGSRFARCVAMHCGAAAGQT